MQNWQEQRAWFDKEKAAVAPYFFDAHKVEAYRFIRCLEKKWHKPKGEVHGVGYLASNKLQGSEVTARLGTLVLDSGAYKGFGLGYSGCVFEPTFGYRIWSKDDFITIIFCLSCQELVIMQNDPDIPERPFGPYTAQYNLSGYFNNDTKKEIANLCYDVFPAFVGMI